ncbi:sensor histidine kinase [Gorillibacterium sp. sgz5001074]|uniref:sensor histidine kinase n=1 Tax=Gorillibacterium sp. sgz5001074 TaxID=3446695 RepID=UPI003F670154
MSLFKKRRFSFYDYFTLKRRIIILFMFSTLTPFVIIGLISYYAIYSILTNKIQTGVQSNLKQVEQSLENTIANLNHVSQQLAFEGTVGRKLDEFLDAGVSYKRFELYEELKEELRLITFTNPSIGLTFYYFKKDGTYNFENLGVREGFSPDRLPLLAEYYGISYYGPHISNNYSDNQYVLSALRKVELPGRDDTYVYIESGFRLTQNILSNNPFREGVSHIILDNDGRIAYSETPTAFPMDTRAPDFLHQGKSGAYQDYVWFKETSNQGWSVITVIPKAVYNKEMNRWFAQILFFSFLFAAVSVLLGWLLWKMVYRPLNNFNKEIKQMALSRGQMLPPARTQIPEFDYLLNQFRMMKDQIWHLFSEVEQKEKRRVDLEVEKLLYQINPHFLMNTLDTVHWLAVMNGQGEIDRLVSSLNKLLYYNLGKLGQASTMEEEIDALQQYLTLQQIRYDFKFDVRLQVEETALKAPVPRFILQPLVENSLYHGLNDDGRILVEVKQNGGMLEIGIHDNGAGMTEEAIRQLFQQRDPSSRKVGMGIGLHYVKRMIENQYGDRAGLKINSVMGEGTSILLQLPIQEVEAIA